MESQSDDEKKTERMVLKREKKGKTNATMTI